MPSFQTAHGRDRSVTGHPDIVVAGGGAAGFFAAVTAAEAGAKVLLLEQGSQFLTKVRISGGGRCNVTHDCHDPRALSERYPRGGRALIGAFARFQPRDVIDWFGQRGVELKTESDGRMFPVTDNSATIVECLLDAARAAGVEMRLRCGLASAEPGFKLGLSTGDSLECAHLLLATGGCRSGGGALVASSLGHTILAPVPSLFTFHIDDPLLQALPGLRVVEAEVAVHGTPLRERGPILITHWGLSGPAVLRLSAWGARRLHDCGYAFALDVDWLCGTNGEELEQWQSAMRERAPGKTISNTPHAALPSRLWEQLVAKAGIPHDTRWARMRREESRALSSTLKATRFQVTGKSLNKEEFVTCGGVSLQEINMRTMESRMCPGLHFAGEICDIDGITGGFNFQAAWTTGWIAGHSMTD